VIHRAPTLALIATVGALAAAAVWACAARGPWYDEFYSLYVGLPRWSWGEALRQHWLVDNHPPLFYALVRAASFLGDSVEARRLLNPIVLALAAVGWAAVLRAHRDLLPVSAGVVLIIAAQPSTLLAASELRSYFLSLAACTVLVLALVAEWQASDGGAERPRRLLWVAAILACNIHIVTTIVALAMFVPFLALSLWRGERRLLYALGGPAVAGGAIFAAVTAVQLPLWLGNTRAFWIPAGFDTARWTLQHMVERALLANPAMLLIAAGGLALLLVQVRRDKRVPRTLETLLLLGAGAALAAAVLTALHLMRPLLIEKYLIGLVPVLAAILALAAAEAFARLERRQVWAWAVALAFALGALVANARQAAAMYSWNDGGAVVGLIVAACPETAVHIDPPFANAYTMSLSPADNLAVMPFAYRLTAARNGFAIEPASSRRTPERCPTLFWGEHDTTRRITAERLLARVQARGFAVTRLELRRIHHGWIASDRPLPR
jgi:hypothetical protein